MKFDPNILYNIGAPDTDMQFFREFHFLIGMVCSLWMAKSPVFRRPGSRLAKDCGGNCLPK